MSITLYQTCKQKLHTHSQITKKGHGIVPN